MGYLHINNLYKDQRILLFKECYALEKIHGTSAHITCCYNDSKIEVKLFSGGVDHQSFSKLFDLAQLADTYETIMTTLTDKPIIFFGEAYGGKCQGMSKTYGPALKFVVFDVKVGEHWLCVPDAHDLATKFKLDFVYWKKIPATLEAISAERDDYSVQAFRNLGITEKIREGVVLRPLVEVHTNNGERIIVKHKRDEFRETKSPRDPNKALELMTDANKIAEEWVTPIRLEHVLQIIAREQLVPLDITHTGYIIDRMIEDINREADGEILKSPTVNKLVGRNTALLYKEWLRKSFTS